MLEKDIVAAIMRFLKTVPHCFAWKQHGGMYGVAGLPDIICCIGGRFVAFEVKTPKGKLTKLQEVTLAKINAAGGAAHKPDDSGQPVVSVDEVKQILKKLEGIS